MSKTILITGSSTGFGRETAEILAREGHKVFATMRDPSGKNHEHAVALMAQGIETLELDVTNTKSIETAVASVLEKTGHIDVLINNAGVAAAGVSEAFTDEQIAKMFDVNVIGVHRTSKAVLPTFRRQKNGLIINIGSILGRITFPFFGLYGASKFAVEAMTDSLRYELSQFGVDIALVQPSAYPTHMYDSALQPNDTKTIEEYGDIGNIPAAMFENFAAMFSGENAPNPNDIAHAISKLIATPDGKRPLRTVVGTSFGSDLVNKATQPIQHESVKALGLSHLETLKTS